MKRIRPSDGTGKTKVPALKQSPLLINLEEAEDPFSSARDSILLLRRGGVCTGRAIKEQSKIQQGKKLLSSAQGLSTGSSVKAERRKWAVKLA